MIICTFLLLVRRQNTHTDPRICVYGNKQRMMSRRRCGTGPEFKPRPIEIVVTALSICTAMFNDLIDPGTNSNFLFTKVLL